MYYIFTYLHTNIYANQSNSFYRTACLKMYWFVSYTMKVPASIKQSHNIRGVWNNGVFDVSYRHSFIYLLGAHGRK